MKRIYFSAILLFTTVSVWGQFSLTGSTYTQDFNDLGTTTSANVTGGSLNNINSSLNGWYFLELGTNANTTITTGNGSSGTSDTYNFGASGNADRALGGVRSGSDVSPILNPRYGFYFTNNTGSDIEALQITYTGETWRRGFDNRRDRLDFQYSNAATSLSTGTWTNVDALDYSNPVSGLPIGSGSLLHSAVINNYILDITIPDGASFFIRWIDLDATDADDGMGIDDFTLTVVDPTPIVFYSKSSGNLTNLSSWGDDPSGSGTAPSNFTNPFQVFIVVNRTTTTLNANWTVSGVRSKVVTGDAASTTTFIIPSSAALTGVIDVSDLATLRVENAILPTFGIIEEGSTINYAQSGTSVIPAGNYHNLTLTGGTKTISAGTTTVAGNIILDGVTNFNGSVGNSEIILSGNFTLLNGSTFAASGGGRPRLLMVGEGTQTLSGGTFILNSVETTDDPVTTLNIALSNATLTLTGSGLQLIQPTHRLSLNGNTLTLQNAASFGDPTEALGTISGSSTSNIIISKTSGSNDIGVLRMTTGGQILGTLEYRDLGAGIDLQLETPLSLATTWFQHLNSDIYTSSTNLLTLLEGATITGPGLGNSFIIGPLARVTNAAGPYTFPVYGKLIYLQIPTPGNVSTFRIQYFDVGIHTNLFTCIIDPVSGYKINEYWDISRTSGTSTASFSIEFDGQNIDPAEWKDNFAPLDGDGIVIAHYNVTNNCWENVSSSAPILPVTQTTVSSDILNSFSPFTFGFLDFGTALPVKFGNVKAYQQGSGVKVDWSNFTESDLVNYQVERSIDGQTFTPISIVNPTLNNGSRADYSYFDAAPFNGVNFYRIQSLEIDGKKIYSVIVRIDTKNDNIKVTVYPNPVTDDQLVLQTPDLKRGVYTVNVFNAVGQLVYNKPINHSGGFVTQSIQLPGSLKSGIYNLQLTGNGVKITRTFILQ